MLALVGSVRLAELTELAELAVWTLFQLYLVSSLYVQSDLLNMNLQHLTHLMICN